MSNTEPNGGLDPQYWSDFADHLMYNLGVNWVLGAGLQKLCEELNDEYDVIEVIPHLANHRSQLDEQMKQGTVAQVSMSEQMNSENPADVAKIEQNCTDIELLELASRSTVRGIVQGLFGVTSFMPGSEKVSMAEDAATRVMLPWLGENSIATYDDYTSVATNWDELAVELAGYICLMNIDHSLQLTIANKETELTIVADSQGRLGLLLEESGDTSEPATMSWSDPPVVAKIVTTVLEALGNDGDFDTSKPVRYDVSKFGPEN